MKYFQTKTPDIRPYCSKSCKTLKWQRIGDAIGILSLDEAKAEDALHIACLETCIKEHIGGEITAIGEAEYGDLEKRVGRWVPKTRESLGGPTTASDTLHAPRLTPAPQQSSEPAAPAAAADAPPAPAATPADQSAAPPLRRRSGAQP